MYGANFVEKSPKTRFFTEGVVVVSVGLNSVESPANFSPKKVENERFITTKPKMGTAKQRSINTKCGASKLLVMNASIVPPIHIGGTSGFHHEGSKVTFAMSFMSKRRGMS